MKVVYRFLGLGGGDWRVVGLVSGSGVQVTPIELEFSGLSGVEEAVSRSSERFLEQIKFSMNGCDKVQVLTNTQEDKFLNGFDCTRSFKDRIELTSSYTPENLPETDDVWLMSDFIWTDARYDINPLDTPEPPFTVYTDASYWPNYKDGRSSVGFVIQGADNGGFIMGSPVTESIKDNNVAEYYAVRSALSFLPKTDKVEICTDSTNVKNIMNEETSNPRFDIVSSLRSEIESFEELNLEHVPRKWTTIADELADIGKNKPILIGNPP